MFSFYQLQIHHQNCAVFLKFPWRDWFLFSSYNVSNTLNASWFAKSSKSSSVLAPFNNDFGSSGKVKPCPLQNNRSNPSAKFSWTTQEQLCLPVKTPLMPPDVQSLAWYTMSSKPLPWTIFPIIEKNSIILLKSHRYIRKIRTSLNSTELFQIMW